MPTNRTYTRRVWGKSGSVLDELSDEQRAWLWGEDSGAFRFFATADELEALWRQHSAEVVAAHVAESPGSRPERWWEYDAPAPRQRLGGTGSPAHECLAYVPHTAYGIPISWVSEWDVEYYNGRARDVHRKLIESGHREGDFKGLAPDPADPPSFESQAAYLRRNNLLLPGEEQRLTEADFEPERLTIE
jgi:hypothetical protein